MQLVLTPELLLEAYKHGLFPMSYSADSPYVHWICPEMRGQLPIKDLHIPRRLKKTIRSAPYEIKINTAFEDVMLACAETTPQRPETWINSPIVKVYGQLHEQGQAHSIECWQDGELIGGLYGLSLGGAFFGESMFSKARDASKIALVHLVARLWTGGFVLLDTQFVNEHLKQFGAYEIPYREYQNALNEALMIEGDFVLEGLNEIQMIEDFLSMKEGG